VLNDVFVSGLSCLVDLPVHPQWSRSLSGVATGVRGCGPHRAALARGGKGAKNAENLKKCTWKFRL